MINRKTLLTFSILSLVVWSSSWWAYRIFRAMDFPHPYSLRPVFMLSAMAVISLLALAHMVYQIASLKNYNPRLVMRVVFFNVIGLLFVAFYALIVSMSQENTWGLIVKSPYPLEYLITVILSAPGYDIILLFFLALISGYIIYSPTGKFKRNEFLKALVAWCLIIFINEMIFQRFIFTFRTSSVSDIFNNIFGGILPGLVLSFRWFRK